MQIIKKINSIFKQGSSRSIAVKRNILYSGLLKCVNIGISLLIVPITLGYLATEMYGVWLILSSVIAWIGLFDIGLTNGLRNKLTEALAINDKNRAKTYVSTTFVLLIGIISLFLLIFTGTYQFVRWDIVFNISVLNLPQIEKVVLITMVFFCLQFVAKIVTTVFYAIQQSAIVDLINTLGSLLSLIIVYILTRITSSGSLLYVAATFSATPVLVYVVVYLIIFYGKYHYLLPSIKYINLRYSKDLIGLGIYFFICQIGAIVLFSASNIIITQLFDPLEVVIYNIAYKYFHVIVTAFMIVQTPLWSAYTDAYAKSDFVWTRNVLKKLITFMFFCTAGSILMLCISPWVYRLWLGDKIGDIVPISLSIACAFYVFVFNVQGALVTFLNGIGKIKLQIYIVIAGSVLYIPLAIYMGKTFGTSGVLWSQSITFILSISIYTIQCYKIVRQTAGGIWNK
jgi:O-antigen/teichoic acid export membrane protein